MPHTVSLAQLHALVEQKLVRSGANLANARSVAASIVAAEADAIGSVGLGYLPTYCRHLKAGKVDGRATPIISHPRSGIVLVDAANGFAHPAIEAGQPVLIERSRQLGIAAMAVRSSYSAGVLGHCIEGIARAGLLVLAFTNSPPNVAPWGGRKPLFGTNPLAFASPRAAGEPLVIDFATSAVTKVALLARAKSGAPLPEGWAFDADGLPTTDAAALKGSMAPAGGTKGAALGLIVELMAAGLTGARWSKDVALYSSDAGGPPGVGQMIMAVDCAAASPDYLERLEDLLTAMAVQEGVRLPGDRRLAARRRAAVDGVRVEDSVLALLNSD